jgi:hypothetical protein
MLLQNISVTELAAIRQAILDSFGPNDTEASDLETMDRLIPVETMIAEATYEGEADKRAGSSILMENEPGSWDDFQCALFDRMQQFI